MAAHAESFGLGFGVLFFVCLVLCLSFGCGGVLFFWLWCCLVILAANSKYKIHSALCKKKKIFLKCKINVSIEGYPGREEKTRAPVDSIDLLSF